MEFFMRIFFAVGMLDASRDTVIAKNVQIFIFCV